MAQYTIREGQTILDVALQLYGDASKVVTLCQKNPVKLPNVLTKTLTNVTIEYDIQNTEVTKYFATNAINISTKFPEITSGAKTWAAAFSPPFVAPSTS